VVAAFFNTLSRFIGSITHQPYPAPGHLSRQTLTLLVVAFTGLLALTVAMVMALGGPSAIVALDHATAQWVADHRATELIAPFIWITALGAARVVVPLLLIGSVVLWLLRRPWLILPLLLSSLAAAASTHAVKLLIHRPRPVAAVLLESSWSFPSGHATIAIALYGFVAYLLLRSGGVGSDRLLRLSRAGLLLLVALLIGLSRIGLGVHYVSDVCGGYLIGGLWLIVAIGLSEWLTATSRVDWTTTVEPARRRACIALGVLALLGYLVFVSQWQPPRPQPPAAQTTLLTGWTEDQRVAAQ